MEENKKPISITKKDFIDIYEDDQEVKCLLKWLPVSTCHMCFSGYYQPKALQTKHKPAETGIKTINYALTPTNDFCTLFIEEQLGSIAVSVCAKKECVIEDELQR